MLYIQEKNLWNKKVLYCTSGNYIFVTLTWTPEACNCFRISVSVFKNKIIKTFKFLKRLWGFFLYQVLIFSCRVVDIKIETMTYCQISIFEKVHWIFLDLFYVEESFSIIIISISITSCQKNTSIKECRQISENIFVKG